MNYSNYFFFAERQFKCLECNLYWSGPTELEKNPFAEKCANGEHVCSKETLMKVGGFQPGNIWNCAWCPDKYSRETKRDLHEERECPNKQDIILKLNFKCLSCSDDKNNKGYRSYEEWLLHRVLEHTEVAMMSCLFCEENGAIKTTDGKGKNNEVKKIIVH